MWSIKIILILFVSIITEYECIPIQHNDFPIVSAFPTKAPIASQVSSIKQSDECNLNNLNIIMISVSLVIILAILFGAYIAITSPTSQTNITPIIIAVSFGVSVIGYLFGIYSEKRNFDSTIVAAAIGGITTVCATLIAVKYKKS
ncbi:hypothetical protein C1645_381103 [Glomus cerebriforme]|uniref:Uncharacterized protein n=1 Tax=Glomus cerebriforme TaxID=658196 RepID=A0A397TIY3_9GLOM|nr:hypothetical protein C1645_381103 [Glomus cerebriforme]